MRLYRISGSNNAWSMAPHHAPWVTELVILVFSGIVIYGFILSVMDAACTADPWANEIEEEVNREEAVPLCHRCLAPQTHNGWFCPECGTTVGPYCNYLPYIYIFSQGELLRIGVTERIRSNSPWEK